MLHKYSFFIDVSIFFLLFPHDTKMKIKAKTHYINKSTIETLSYFYS